MTSFAISDQAAFGFYLRQQPGNRQHKAATAPVVIAVETTTANTGLLEACHNTAPLPQQPQYRLAQLSLLAAVVALHLYLPNWLAPTPLPVIAAKVPPMVIQLQKAQPQPKLAEPVKPQPVQKKVETPKPQLKKPLPKPVTVAKTPQPVVPPVTAQPLSPQPIVSEPVVAAPVVETPVFEPATAEPDYLQNPAPAYPELALENGWEGTVLLSVHVKGDGKADDVQIKSSSGRKILDNAAIATVAGWSFVPAKQGEQTVDSWVEVPIEFSLSNS